MGSLINLEGFVDIELIDKYGKVKYKDRGHNTISDAGLKAFLVEAIGLTMQNSRCRLGNNILFNQGFALSSSSSYVTEYNFNEGVVSPLLLNLPGSPEFNFANGESVVYYMNNQLEPDFGGKVTGYALNNASPSLDGLEGACEPINAQTLVDNFSIANRWVFREGVASGTINAVSLVLMDKDKRTRLIRSNKNFQDITPGSNPEPKSATKVLPGGAGEVASNSFWLNYESNGLKGYIYNTETGEITNQYYTIGYTISQVLQNNYKMFIDTEYIYAINSTISSGNAYIQVYDQVSGSMVTGFYGPKYFYYAKLGFLNVGGELYLVVSGNIVSGVTTVNTEIYKLNKGSGGYYASCSDTPVTYESLGFIVPNDCCYFITSDRFDNLTYNVSNLTNTGTSSYPAASLTYNFSNGSNILGSITGTREPLGLQLVGGNSPYKMIYDSNYRWYSSYITDNSGSLQVRDNIGNFTVSTGTGNAFSCYLLNQPIEKLDTDILHVTYGFKVSNV